MPGLRERKKSQTRERLMYAANRLFAERGFDQVTVEDVAAEADVSPRTFFRYFDPKAGVVFGAARDRIGRMEALLDARTTDQSVLDVFRGYWLGEAGDLYEHPD